NRATLEMLGDDADWVKRHILAALLTNTSYTYEDPEHGDLVIQPLANGDAVTYPKRGSTVETDTHYLAQAAAIGATDDVFATIYDEIMEHPVNAGADVVVYVPDGNVASVVAMTNFRAVTD